MTKIPFIAIGNNELGKEIQNISKCPNCKKSHKVEYGQDVKTGEVDTLLGFVKCPKDKKVYLVCIDKKKLN